MGRLLIKVALGACFLSLLSMEAHCADPEDVRMWEAAADTKSLIKALGNEGSTAKVGVAAAQSLGRIRDSKAVDPLVITPGDEYSDVREAAAYSLGALGDPRTVVPLIDLLGDTHAKVREAAAWTLGKFGDRRAVEPLLKTMGDENPKVREAAAKVLEELGEPLGRLIQGTLAGSREAGNELVKRKDPRSLDALVLSLRNRDGQVRRAAATALRRIRNPRAVDGLVVMAGGWGLRDRVVASAALLEIDWKSFPDLLAAFFRVMACPASLVYLLCIVSVVILAMYFTGWIDRRRGRDV